MSTSTAPVSTTPRTRPTVEALGRMRQSLAVRREAARGRREVNAILAGHHGPTMREELLVVLERS